MSFDYEFRHLDFSKLHDKLMSIDMLLDVIDHEPAHTWTIEFLTDEIEKSYEFGLCVVSRTINDTSQDE